MSAKRARRPNPNAVLRGIEFAIWALKLERQPTVHQIMAQFDVRECTAYKYRAAWLESNAFAIFHRQIDLNGAFTVPSSDLFEGVFDDPVRNERIKYRDGRVVATMHGNSCLTAPIASELGMGGAFGTYPPPPTWLPIPGAATSSGDSQ